MRDKKNCCITFEKSPIVQHKWLIIRMNDCILEKLNLT